MHYGIKCQIIYLLHIFTFLNNNYLKKQKFCLKDLTKKIKNKKIKFLQLYASENEEKHLLWRRKLYRRCDQTLEWRTQSQKTKPLCCKQNELSYNHSSGEKQEFRDRTSSRILCFLLRTSEMARKTESWRKRGSGKWEYIWPLWLTLVLHVLGIFLFTRGFLLTRTELPYYSNCSDISHSPCFSSSSPSSSSSDYLNRSANSSDGSCWTKPAIKRLVIIVLDALRYFVFLFWMVRVTFSVHYIATFMVWVHLILFSLFRFDFVAPSSFFTGQLLHLLNSLFLQIFTN